MSARMKKRTGLTSIMNMDSTEMTTLKSVILMICQALDAHEQEIGSTYNWLHTIGGLIGL